jgi:hypothetical protein
MEYVEGETLAALLRAARKGERELPVSIALRALLDGISGLHGAHVFIGLNLLSDLLYNMLDPRTRAMTHAR